MIQFWFNVGFALWVLLPLIVWTAQLTWLGRDYDPEIT